MSKAYQHFGNDQIVADILRKILRRHGCPLRQVAEGIAQQIFAISSEIGSAAGLSRLRLVVGLSGGLDSSLVASLAARAAGPENVIAVTMPRDDKDSQSLAQAALIAKTLGLREGKEFFTVPIQPIVRSELKVLSRAQQDVFMPATDPMKQSMSDKLRIGNLASRARVAILYDFSKALGGIVLGTLNKTEFLLGYTAKFGTPMSCDLAVLSDLYKVEVRAIAEELRVPEPVLHQVSTTGYYAGQTHEEELGGAYDELDSACFLLFELGYSAAALADEFEVRPEFVENVMRLHRSSGHKRALQPRGIPLRTRGARCR
jgi:NAD+ synthase